MKAKRHSKASKIITNWKLTRWLLLNLSLKAILTGQTSDEFNDRYEYEYTPTTLSRCTSYAQVFIKYIHNMSNTLLLFSKLLFYGKAVKRADVPPDDKLLSLPMDTHNTRDVTNTLPVFGGREEGKGEVAVWTSDILTRLEKPNASCFTPIFCEAMLSLRLCRPINVEAWVSHGRVWWRIRIHLKQTLCQLVWLVRYSSKPRF